MTIDLAAIRTVLGFIGMGLIAIGLAKWAGVQINIKGEFWQIMLAGLAVKMV